MVICLPFPYHSAYHNHTNPILLFLVTEHILLHLAVRHSFCADSLLKFYIDYFDGYILQGPCPAAWDQEELCYREKKTHTQYTFHHGPPHAPSNPNQCTIRSHIGHLCTTVAKR